MRGVKYLHAINIICYNVIKPLSMYMYITFVGILLEKFVMNKKPISNDVKSIRDTLSNKIDLIKNTELNSSGISDMIYAPKF